MRYVTLAEYQQLYNDSIEGVDFNRFVIGASQLADRLTTGIDGVKKLKIAFPIDGNDEEVVKAAICGVIHLMNEVHNLDKTVTAAQGTMLREDGTVIGKVATSISSGSESISYSVQSNGQTMASTIVGDAKAQDEAYKAILSEGFRGITDANGVNLLYMGVYPLDISEVEDV